MEKDRVQHYLHPSTEPKLMSKIEHEILAEHETKLLEKEGSGVSWLLNNDRKEDLARLFRLFTRIPNGVDPIAKAFKDHVTERGLELVEMATQSINEEGTHTPRIIVRGALYGAVAVRPINALKTVVTNCVSAQCLGELPYATKS